MGRPKSTGNSHNKKSSTYESKRTKPKLNRQKTLLDMFKKDKNTTSSSSINDNAVDEMPIETHERLRGRYQ